MKSFYYVLFIIMMSSLKCCSAAEEVKERGLSAATNRKFRHLGMIRVFKSLKAPEECQEVSRAFTSSFVKELCARIEAVRHNLALLADEKTLANLAHDMYFVVKSSLDYNKLSRSEVAVLRREENCGIFGKNVSLPETAAGTALLSLIEKEELLPYLHSISEEMPSIDIQEDYEPLDHPWCRKTREIRPVYKEQSSMSFGNKVLSVAWHAAGYY